MSDCHNRKITRSCRHREIAAASDQQTQGMEQIERAVEQMGQATQQSAANDEQSAAAAEELCARAAERQSTMSGVRSARVMDTTIGSDSLGPTVHTQQVSRMQRSRRVRVVPCSDLEARNL